MILQLISENVASLQYLGTTNIRWEISLAHRQLNLELFYTSQIIETRNEVPYELASLEPVSKI